MAVSPSERHPALIIDANAVAICAFTSQALQAATRRDRGPRVLALPECARAAVRVSVGGLDG